MGVPFEACLQSIGRRGEIGDDPDRGVTAVVVKMFSFLGGWNDHATCAGVLSVSLVAECYRGAVRAGLLAEADSVAMGTARERGYDLSERVVDLNPEQRGWQYQGHTAVIRRAHRNSSLCRSFRTGDKTSISLHDRYMSIKVLGPARNVCLSRCFGAQ